MQTAGRRWQDSSLYADPLIPSRENLRARARARASLSVQHVSRLRHVEYGVNRKTGELEENGTALRIETRSRGIRIAKETSARSKSKPFRYYSHRDGNDLWMLRRTRRDAANGIIVVFPGNTSGEKGGRKKNTRDRFS